MIKIQILNKGVLFLCLLIFGCINDEKRNLEINKIEENKSFEKDIHKQDMDTVFFGNYYNDEVINSQGISLDLLNEEELFNDGESWCFVGGKKYKFKVEVFGISQKTKLKNATFSTGKVIDIDSTERTFTYIPPKELVIVDVDYSIEAKILSIERVIDSTAIEGYRERIEFIDGLFDTRKLQACKGNR